MPTKMTVHDAIDGIVDAAVAKLRTPQPAPLSSLTAVAEGPRTRDRPTPPFLWVAVSSWTRGVEHALHVRLTVELMVTAEVHSEEPVDGWREAMRLSSAAATLLGVDRKLGLAYVSDVLPRGGSQIGQTPRSTIWRAADQVDVVATVLEP